MDPGTVVAIVALVVTIIASLLGVVYAAGRLSARVDKLEEWRGEVRSMHGENLARFDRLEEQIRELAIH